MTRSTRFVDSYLGYLLGQANQALYKDFDSQVRAAGLTSVQWRVLATLHDSEPMTVSQLARDVLAQQPTVTKLVQRMCDQGWLTLSNDPKDQRCTLVAASEVGQRLILPLVAQARQHEAATLQALSPVQKNMLKTLLGKLSL